MSDLAGGQIGPETKWALKFEGGQLKVSVDNAGTMGSAGLYLAVGADQVISAIEAAIPGQLDDQVLDLLKAALKAI